MSEAQQFYIDNMASQKMTVCDGKDFIFGGANWVNWMIQAGWELTPKKYMNGFIDNNRLKDALEHMAYKEDKRVEFGDLDGLIPNNAFCDHFLV